MSVVGEKPITVLQSYLGVTANRLSSISSSTFRLRDTSFNLPRGIDQKLLPFGKCFETVLALYEGNPYSWSAQVVSNNSECVEYYAVFFLKSNEVNYTIIPSNCTTLQSSFQTWKNS